MFSPLIIDYFADFASFAGTTGCGFA